jgi:probable rRNA maturation factor
MSHAGHDQRNSPVVVSLIDQQSAHRVIEDQLLEAVRVVVEESEFRSANVSVAVVDDAAIHELNRRYLDHDWPTDVLSFVLNNEGDHLEGEVIISADTAAASAAEIGWPAAAEQLLYVIHGTLHIVGYNDKTPADELEMRAAEARYLQRFGLKAPQATSGSEALAGRSTPGQQAGEAQS